MLVLLLPCLVQSVPLTLESLAEELATMRNELSATRKELAATQQAFHDLKERHGRQMATLTLETDDIASDNGHLLFHTGDTERMRITAAGSVGIGTDSPAGTCNLQVGDSNGALRIGGASGLDVEHDASGTTTSTIKQLSAHTDSAAHLKIHGGHVTLNAGSAGTQMMRVDETHVKATNLVVGETASGMRGGIFSGSVALTAAGTWHQLFRSLYTGSFLLTLTVRAGTDGQAPYSHTLNAAFSRIYAINLAYGAPSVTELGSSAHLDDNLKGCDVSYNNGGGDGVQSWSLQVKCDSLSPVPSTAHYTVMGSLWHTAHV